MRLFKRLIDLGHLAFYNGLGGLEVGLVLKHFIGEERYQGVKCGV